MKSEVHVVIIRIPFEDLVEAARKKVPHDYQIVDTEFVDNDAIYFSFQKGKDEEILLESNEETITITESEE